MADRVSKLTARLIDQVSAPARKITGSLTRIKTAVKGVDGMTGGRALDAAIARNNTGLERYRMRMLDAVGAAYVLKSAIQRPIEAAIEFESSMADVKKVVDAFSNEATFKQFTDDIKQLSREVPRSITELSQIAAAAGQAGLPHDEIVSFTREVAKIATAFELSTDETGTALARLKSALNLSIPDVVLLADHMNTLANNMATSEGEVLEIVRRVGALGKTAGLETKNVAALGAAMNSAGVDADVAATAIRNMIINTTGNLTKSSLIAFEKLKIDPSQFKRDVADKGIDAFRDMFRRIKSLQDTEQVEVMQGLFGKRAIDALGPLLNNLGELDRAFKLVEDDTRNAGAAAREYEVRNKTLANQLQTFSNRIKELNITIGQSLIPALNNIVAIIGPIVSAVADWTAATPKLVASIIILTGSLIALRIAAIGIGFTFHFIKGAVLAIPKAVTTILPFLARLRTAFMFTGVGAVLTGIAMAAIWIKNNWEGLVAFFQGFARGFMAAIEPIRPALEPVIGLIEKVWNAIDSLLGPVGASKEEWGSWGEAAGRAVGFVYRSFLSVPIKIASICGEILKILGNLSADMVQAGRDIVTGLWDGMREIFANMMAWISSKASAIRNAFTFSWSGGGEGNDAAGGGETPADLRGGRRARAGGGPVSRGNRYLVGEKREEMFTANRSGYVHAQVPQAQGANIKFEFSFNISGGNNQPREIAEEVMRKFEHEAQEVFRRVYADTGMRFA